MKLLGSIVFIPQESFNNCQFGTVRYFFVLLYSIIAATGPLPILNPALFSIRLSKD